MYMFTSSKGRNQTLARDVLNRLIQQGRVQYVPHLNIVDAAIDAVAQTARQNGVDSRLSSVT
jgi:putative NIF3 family GTP cyclohydrolase 1 type 2